MQSKDGLNPEEDKRSSATNFSADKTPSRLKQKVYNLMVRQIGAIEKKAQKVRNVSAHKFGSDFIAKTHADYSKQVKEILSDKGATSHMLVFDREGIPGTQFNIDYDRKEQLMKNAYYTTWTEIEKQTGKKPEKPWDAPARDNHISTSR